MSCEKLILYLKAILYETSNAVGTSLFVFSVLPSLDLPRSVLIMNGISFLPSLIKLLFQLNMKPNTPELSTIETTLMNFFGININKPMQKCTLFMLNLLAIAMQLTLMFIVIFSDFKVIGTFWKIPIALLLVSISATKNICINKHNESNDNKDETCVDRVFMFFSKAFTSMEKSRHKIGLFTSLWQICVKCLFVFILRLEFKFDAALFVGSFKEYSHFWPFLAQYAASILFYLSCSLAFKLRMHRVCFAFPLTLITPVSLAVALFLCHVNSFFVCATIYSQSPFLWHLILGVSLWWISHLWTTNSIWNVNQNIGKDSKRPFKFQFFSSVFGECSLMLDSYSNPLSSKNKLLENSKDSTAKLNDTVLYICATLWHENNNEMLQLLKSIMRYDLDQKNSSSGGGYFEAHLFFDDAIELRGNCAKPNGFVQNFVQIVSEAADFMHKRSVKIEPPTKMTTPYGGRLIFKLPGSNNLVVHLKDKSKIRIKKVFL